MHQSNFSKWFLLVICLIASLAGIFQIGKLIGLAIYSSDFGVNSIGIWQVGLISSGVWGVSEFVRTMRKLKISPKYNDKKINKDT
ncbi:hypothetical protein [Cognaticolwellia beringensis]|uniref:Uncharacterized protein n=1 Tax=Cognaticolwellia beringensis TaxID=1967665 RepID=A0A222GD00_9GAMM|nr:hypothetical protein [Cognaticolwellia beringensis]ASP49765.1 hypothetical protein B5D82_19505 [Cognaticolwellia beringensis]